MGTKRTFLLYNKQKIVVMNKIKHLQVYKKKEIDWKMYLLMKNRLHTDSTSDHRQRNWKTARPEDWDLVKQDVLLHNPE